MTQPSVPSPRPKPAKLTLYRYRLPLRQAFEHFAASREINEGLLVVLTLADGTVGLGEGVPRSYVTGETVESALAVVRDLYAPRLASPEPLAEGPLEGSAYGVWHNAAWCACELAYLDAWSRAAESPLADFLGRLLGLPVSRKIRPHAAGVISADTPEAIRRSILRMRIWGMHDFKLKVGMPGDRENLWACYQKLRRGLGRRRLTLRVDANGAWSADEARITCQWMKGFAVTVVEQPLPKGDEADLSRLRRETGMPVMLDESLIDRPSAEKLAQAGAADFWNLRVSKNGGLLQTLRLADLARANKIGICVGAMVGESGILSAAARTLLLLVPEVRFVENSYGKHILAEDLVQESTHFGYGGRLRPLRGPGLGVTLDEAVMERRAERVADIPLA